MRVMLAAALRLMLWATTLVKSAAGTQPGNSPRLPDIADQDFIERCVRAHNRFRGDVAPPASDMLYMTWDEALAKSARAWARHCNFSHNHLLRTPGKVHPKFSPVGENIWVSSSSSFIVEKPIEMWKDEVSKYNYRTNKCSDVCGHYTQVVWAKSYKVGCAVHNCPQGILQFSPEPTSIIFVCNYGDAGNFKGSRPYKEGKPCSSCQNTACDNNMCRNDFTACPPLVAGYSWSPSWDPGKDENGSCTPLCIGLLITRPVLFLLTLLGVFGVQNIYPNIFAYE
ncbi:glioma pathogenesis-related protein 1-like [Arapaima gigas]